MNTITNLSPEVAIQFCMRMLSRPFPDLIAGVGNYHVNMEQNQGNILRQSRYDNLPTQPVPLGPSGTNPPAMNLNRLDIDAQIDWYGGYVALTEQVLLINQDRVLEETLDLLSQSLKETEDQLTREHMVNAAPFVNAIGGVNGDNPTELVRSDIDALVKVLRGNNAKFLMDSIDGEDRFGTGPVRNSYWAKASTDMIGDLEQITGFINAANYPDTSDLLEAEWCSIGNLRFLLSSVWPVSLNASALGNNVENIIVQGQEAVSEIDLDGYSAQYRFTPPRIAGGPLWLYGTSGYVFAQVPQVTNFTWIYNLRCTLRS
jgi:N4-gp56 family major capsid protein